MITVDYIVVGAGASGIAFADTIVGNSDFSVAIVDVNSAPGGHWHSAHDYHQLDLPAARAGMNGLPFSDLCRADPGRHDNAPAHIQTSQVLDYYDRAMTDRLLASEQVQFFSDCYHLGAGLMQAIGWHTRLRFKARRKIVDATQCWHRVRERDEPRFTHDPDVLVITPNDLSPVWSVAPHLHDKYCVLGAGIVAVETVGQLLRLGVAPDQICWVKPRDSWFLNRDTFSPRGWLNTLQAITETPQTHRLEKSLEKAGHLVRIFPDETPTKFHADVVSPPELAPLHAVTHIVRKGRVRSISSLGMILEDGVEPMPGRNLYIDCTANRIVARPRPEVFQSSAITLQMTQMASAAFSGSLIAAIELLNRSEQEKNRLSAPLSLPERSADIPMLFAESLRNQRAWFDEPELHDWLVQNRLGSTGTLLSSILAEPEQRTFAVRQFQQLLRNALTVLYQKTTRTEGVNWEAFSEASRPHLQTGTEPD